MAKSANIKRRRQGRIRTTLKRPRRITKNDWNNLNRFLYKSMVISLIVTAIIAFFFYKLADKQLKILTKKSTEEIVEALFPNDFSLLIDGKYYSPGSTCEIESKTKEIHPYFAVNNNSKYPAKDITISIYLDKNTIKEGVQALRKCFLANNATKGLEMSSSENTTTNFEGLGFVIPSPIYPGKRRNIHSLKLQMIKNKTIIIVDINGQHKFYIVYNVSKDGEKEIP